MKTKPILFNFLPFDTRGRFASMWFELSLDAELTPSDLRRSVWIGQLTSQWPYSFRPLIWWPFLSTIVEHQRFLESSGSTGHPQYMFPSCLKGKTHRAKGLGPLTVRQSTRQTIYSGNKISNISSSNIKHYTQNDK